MLISQAFLRNIAAKRSQGGKRLRFPGIQPGIVSGFRDCLKSGKNALPFLLRRNAGAFQKRI